MVNLRKLKLNQITDRNLDNREMRLVLGGMDCGCPCYYASGPSASRSAGSSTEKNSDANHVHGYNPGYACNQECWGTGPEGSISVYLSHGDQATGGNPA